MKVSLEWLRRYAPLDAPVDTMVGALVDTGTEVDHVDRGPEGVLVVRVVRLEPVPGKNLRFVDIDTGTDQVRLITGATNLATGDLAAWAPPGTRLPGWDEPVGVRTFFHTHESPGMLCSAAELRIGEAADEIHVLERGVPGMPLHEAVALDVVLEVEPTTNRPDCLCHLGIARELAAALHEDLRPPSTGIPEALMSAVAVGKRVAVRNEEPAGCRRFTARVIENVKVGPSPEWLQRRLRAAGQNPINSVVDVTNYVMLELGQPLHAFDKDRFVAAGGGPGPMARVVVRRGRSGDRLQCLDGVERELTPDDLAVCSGETAASIAGIIGGAPTAVDHSTRNVLLEAAAWDGVLIRATSERLGRRTEASARFEKDLSDELPPPALDRAAALIAEVGQGHVLDGVVDVAGVRQPEIPPIEITAGTIRRRLGCAVEADEASTALARLGFSVEHEGDTLRVVPPYFRRDVSIAEDIVEEVGRSIGYSRVPSTLPGRRVPVTGVLTEEPVDERVRDLCIGAGFDEAITYSFTSAGLAGRLPGAGGTRPAIAVRNPLSEDWSVLRTGLLPGVCRAVGDNLHHGVDDVRLFEVGRAFWEGARTGPVPGSTPDGADRGLVPLPGEPLLLAMAASAPGRAADASAQVLRHVQSVMARLGRELGGADIAVAAAPVEGLHPSRSGRLRHGGRDVGVIGEIAPEVAALFGIHDRIAVAELQLDAVAPAVARVARYRTPPKFPSMVQDLAVVVDGDLPAVRALTVIGEAGGALLEDVQLYDEYRGAGVGGEDKSWTFRLTFRAADHTLAGEEVQEAQRRILDALRTACGAEVRG